MALTEVESSCDELMRAQASLWSHIFNYIDSMSLKCAVELGIPDAIHNHGKPITLPELLAALSISPAKATHMRRLMRMLTHSGIFARSNADDDNYEVYSLTPLSRLLVGNKGYASFILAALHPIMVNPFQSMSAWFKSDEPTPFSFEHGCNFWEITNRNPQFNMVFSEGMASDAKFLMDVLLKNCGSVAIVAIAISESFPDIRCSVLDLPQVINGTIEKGAVDFIAGDMFDYIPPADVVLLKWILHDWSDEDCIKILKRCKEAITCKKDGGKVVIIDQVMGLNSSYENSTTTQLYFDMLMMVDCGGAERGEQEWGKIFTGAGFKQYKIIPALGLRSIIEVYP